MECPYLEVIKGVNICNASTRHMKPTASEMDRYCTTEVHDHCPILLAYTLRKSSADRLNWNTAA